MQQFSYQLFRNSELIGILLTCALAAVILYFIYRHLPEKTISDPPVSSRLSFVRPSVPKPVYTKKDFLSVSMVTVLYAIVSMWQLGSTTFPTTTWQPSRETYKDQEIILELTEETSFDAVYMIYCEGDNNSAEKWQLGIKDMHVEGSNDLSSWEELFDIDQEGIYEYTIAEGDWDYQYIRLTADKSTGTLTEIGFKAKEEDRFLAISVKEDINGDPDYPASLIIDEQDKLTIDPTYMNEGYFDEVYHPRNAAEIVNGQYMYATVHPLLGTNLIALGIKIFGLNPFGWRIMGALFGIAMIPLFYALCKLLFAGVFIPTCGIVLLAADFMHLTTSRIGTLEPFSVFFIILMFYFMLSYCQSSFYDTPLKQQLKTLLYCGISMGLAIAAKWTACYSAVGLAILLFANLIMRFIEYRKAKTILETTEENEMLSDEARDAAVHIRHSFPRCFWITIGMCFVFFIFIPVIIYWVSYLPDHVWRDGWSVSNVWSQNMYMYNYHIDLEATHPYQSSWYQWILDLRPIWYHLSTDSEGIKHSIACFSNPLLTWAGLLAFAFALVKCIVEKDRLCFAVLIGYLTALGPWILFVKRCVFAYHFYPSSIFLILLLLILFQSVVQYKEKWKKFIMIFMAAYVILFVLFLPVTAGFGTSTGMIKALEWLPGWYFG